MKFSISSSILLKHLQNLSGIAGGNNALPILDCFLFELQEGKLNIAVSDLETYMSSKIDVAGEDSGSICIPARILIDTLKTFSDEELTFNIVAKKYSIELISNSGNYKLTGFGSEEFPKMPALESPASVEIESSVLLNIINKTLFATGNDDLRPVLTGVLFQLEEKGGVFVATDAHKMVKYVTKEVTVSSPSSYVVPKKPLSLFKSVSPKGAVCIEYNVTNVSFTFDNTVITSRLIDGKYPNYDAVIPKDNPNKLILEKDLFLNSIKRVSVFANKVTNQIRLEMEKGKEIKIFAEDVEFDNSASENLDCTYKGEKLEIGFNSKYLSDVLSSIDGKKVEIELSTPSRAGILKPCDSEDDITLLVMPTLLNN